jgi:hypothetical protein
MIAEEGFHGGWGRGERGGERRAAGGRGGGGVRCGIEWREGGRGTEDWMAKGLRSGENRRDYDGQGRGQGPQ